MRILRSFLYFLISLILFLVAFNFAASGIWRVPADPVLGVIDRWLMPAGSVVTLAMWRALGGVACLLVLGAWLLSLTIWRSRSRAIQSRSSNGEVVLIHPGALLKFVRLQVESHPAVVTQRVRVRQKGSRGLAIWVMVQVQPIDSLPNIKRQLEEMIRNSFARVLGIEKLDDLTVIIGLDEKTLNLRPGPAGTPEPRPDPPLRGTLDLKPPVDVEESQPAPPRASAPVDVSEAPEARLVHEAWPEEEPVTKPEPEAENATDGPALAEQEAGERSEPKPDPRAYYEPEAEAEAEAQEPQMPKFFPKS